MEKTDEGAWQSRMIIVIVTENNSPLPARDMFDTEVVSAIRLDSSKFGKNGEGETLVLNQNS